MESWKTATALCHDEDAYFEHHGAIVPPLYQNSLFAFESWEDIEKAFDNKSTSYLYSRLMNPSVEIVEKKIARLCGGEKAKLMASGMGAISSAIMSVINHGDHIVTLDSIYGPANSFISSFLKEKCHISATFIRGTDPEEWAKSLQSNTSLFYLESPTSMNFDLQDIQQVCKIARENGVKTIIDNTWATPLYQRPIQLGVDLEVHSVSKYLGGHSDLVAGAVVGKKADLDRMVVTENALMGAKIAPFEAWLLLRSLRTLPLRMKRHEESTFRVAKFLEANARIRIVHYPGLKSHPQHSLAKKQMSGCSGLMSFVLDTEDLEIIKSFVNHLQLFKIGVSWGGHESLVYAPVISYSRELSAEQFLSMGITPGMLRISVGLEDPADLIADLDIAMKKAFGIGAA